MAERRISVREAVSDGIAFWRTSWRQAVVPLAIASLLAMAAQVLERSAAIAVNLAYVAAVVVLQGALFRLALAGKTEPPLDAPGPAGLQWRATEWRLLGMTLLLYLVLIVAFFVTVFLLAVVAAGFIGQDMAGLATPEELAAALSPTAQGVLAAMVIAAALAVGWMLLRLSLAAPATVAQRRIRLFSTWALTRGQVLPILGAAALIALPLLVISLLAGMIDSAEGDLMNTPWAGVVARGVGLFFYIPISVGMLSHIYLRLHPEGQAAEF